MHCYKTIITLNNGNVQIRVWGVAGWACHWNPSRLSEVHGWNPKEGESVSDFTAVLQQSCSPGKGHQGLPASLSLASGWWQGIRPAATLGNICQEKKGAEAASSLQTSSGKPWWRSGFIPKQMAVSVIIPEEHHPAHSIQVVVTATLQWLRAGGPPQKYPLPAPDKIHLNQT